MAESLPPVVLVHEDADIVAALKTPGEPVIAARGVPPEACLRRRLEAQTGARLLVVHRIDRDVSGLVVFARNVDAHRALNRAFEEGRVEKAYVAFVAGEPEPRGRVDLALHAARRGKARPARPDEPGRREAVTEYEVRRRWRRGEDRVACLEVRPLTGRHHQIRVHLRAVGAPILFDGLYGRGRMPAGLEAAPCRRLALHAHRLVVPAPRGAQRLVLEAPLPRDLEALRAWLDAGWLAEPG